MTHLGFYHLGVAPQRPRCLKTLAPQKRRSQLAIQSLHSVLLFFLGLSLDCLLLCSHYQNSYLIHLLLLEPVFLPLGFYDFHLSSVKDVARAKYIVQLFVVEKIFWKKS